MSDIWNFLYNPTAANTQNGAGGSSTTAMPDWFTDYTRNLLAGAQAATAEPYQPYGAQRIAELTPDQVASADTIRGGIGNWKPNIQQGGALVQQGANTSSAGSINPMISQAQGALQPSLYANTGASAQPYMNQASSGLNASNGAAAGLGALSQQSLPGQINNYMNPYTNQVVDQIATRGARNMTENLLPAVNSTFTGAGQFGSTRNADFTNRALRDTNESILNAQSAALQGGYQNAAQNYMGDTALQGSLLNQSGTLQSNNASKNMGLADTASTIGSRDFATQQQGAGALGQLGSTLAGATNADATRAIQGGQQLGALGQIGQNLNASDAGLLSAAGQTQQTQDQTNLNLAYQDYLEQLNAPKNNLQFQNSIIQGMPVSTSQLYNQNSSTTTNAGQDSPLLQMLRAMSGTDAIKKI